ncbi:MAG: DNA-binding transcriptional ArsR family regulator [Saprospiraceae bacterium]|jgi:DNA-binding transcriptional ArsR family regulator
MNTVKHNLPPLDYGKVREAEFIVSTLHHKRRQRILDLLETFGAMTAEHLSDEINLDLSTTDNHINMLRRIGVLIVERRERAEYFFLNETRLEQITNAVRNFIR